MRHLSLTWPKDAAATWMSTPQHSPGGGSSLPFPHDESTCQRWTAQSVHLSMGVMVMGGQLATGGAEIMDHLAGLCPQQEAHILAQARHRTSSFPP